MVKFAKDKDTAALDACRKNYEALFTDLNNLNAEIAEYIQQLATACSAGVSFVGIAELDIENMEAALLGDIQQQFINANVKFELEMDGIYKYVSTMSAYVSSDWNSISAFTDVVERDISALNFFEDGQYQDSWNMFRQYTGNFETSRYPYYP